MDNERKQMMADVMKLAQLSTELLTRIARDEADLPRDTPGEHGDESIQAKQARLLGVLGGNGAQSLAPMQTPAKKTFGTKACPVCHERVTVMGWARAAHMKKHGLSPQKAKALESKAEKQQNGKQTK